MGYQNGTGQTGTGQTATGQDETVKGLAEAIVLITKRLLKEDSGEMEPTMGSKYPTKETTKDQTNGYENHYGGDAYSEEPSMKSKQSMMSRPTYKQPRKPRSAYRS